MEILKSSGQKFKFERVEQCFEVIDEDGSGAIDFEEFLAVSISMKYFMKPSPPSRITEFCAVTLEAL